MTVPRLASRTLLLDLSSLAYRAFFALPATIGSPDGRPINAVHGYLDMTARLIRERDPGVVVHCIDHDWRPADRVAAYAGYKSERPPDPDALPPQFEVLDAVLAAFGAVRCHAVGWEADDVIGTLTAVAPSGARLDVVTGDRDLLQLVSDVDPIVRVLFTVRGVSELAVFDEAGVTEKYGIPPSRYVDFATLRGDPSDGLPGVRGVGEKTARELVGRYASLDALVEAAGVQTPALARRLREAGEYLAAMREVVPVKRDRELVTEIAERDDDLLDGLAEEHGLAGPVRRLREALDAQG